MPKRKAVAPLSGLVDDDDDLLMDPQPEVEASASDAASPPAKRSRNYNQSKNAPKTTSRKPRTASQHDEENSASNAVSSHPRSKSHTQAKTAPKPRAPKSRTRMQHEMESSASETVALPSQSGNNRQKSTALKSTTRKTQAAPRKRGPVSTAHRGSPRTNAEPQVDEEQETEEAEEEEEEEEEVADAPSEPEEVENEDDEVEEESDSDLEVEHEPKMSKVRQGHKLQGQPQYDEMKKKDRKMTEEGFEYTPTNERKTKNLPAKPSAKRGRPRKKASAEPKEPEQEGGEHPEAEAAASEPDERVETGLITTDKASLPSSPQKFSSPSRRRPTSAGSEKETEVTLRRKLGNMTKKYEASEARYRDLREIGVVQAGKNFEKLQKAVEHQTKMTNNYVASLEKEVKEQRGQAAEAEDLRRKLQDRDSRIQTLGKDLDTTASNADKAQAEIKTLQAKLTAARNAAASLDNAKQSTNSAARNGGPRVHSATANAEASQAAQIALLKEDLYSDLTGLIIRDVKMRENDDVYDCIQTGVNGTLRFKLAVAHGQDRTTTNLEMAEFHYMPLLDENFDRPLLKLLPDYLAVDITFSRQHAAKFYSRVVDTLTKKIIEE